MIDTHAHLDGEEFRDDLPAVIQRAREAGVEKVFIPAIDLATSQLIPQLCSQYPGYLYPMAGLHPEEVRADWREVLQEIKLALPQESAPSADSNQMPLPEGGVGDGPLAIGEVGLDFYWSREFEQEQLLAFEEQVRWSVVTRLPLMIHCRKAQNEMVKMLRRYEKDLPGGVFHCFTGNAHEAAELLQFQRFVLGIGGVLTFKKSHLPEVLTTVPVDRVVLETDAPYMAPVPMRGKRNESSFVKYVLLRMAECYNMSPEDLAAITTQTVRRVFPRFDETFQAAKLK